MSEKCYDFVIRTSCKKYGYVYASSLKEAKKKIANKEWDDIYDEDDEEEFEKLIEIKEIEE